MSSTSNTFGEDNSQELLMKAVDGELSGQEARELEALLAEHPEYRKELQQYKNIKEVTQKMKFKSPSAEIWDTYWLGVYNRLERGIAWILFSLGAVALLTYGGFKLIESIISDSNLELVVKAGILLCIAGTMLLLVSVIREKYFTFRRDPYREIQR
jgi:hypothetical protein